jgi:beta-lactamase regulating signal transducer with metallopeptidase domain
MTESIQIFAQGASAALISSIWQGVVLAAILWLCLKFAPRMTAGVRFILWSAVFVATALLPIASTVFTHRSSDPVAASLHSSVSAFVLDSRWALGIAGFWAVFAIARLLLLAKHAFRISALWKRSTPVVLTPALESILARPGLRRSTLCTSQEIGQPCVIGFFAPRILIPGWLLESATASEIEQIVLHESAHLRRFDDWTNLLQKLAVACFPLSPALLWIERRLCAEREIACDESVVRATNAPRDYATCLTNLAEQRLSRRNMTAALSLGAWERRSQLAGRIESILRGNAGMGPMKTRALALSLLAVIVGGAIKLSSTMQLVAFASARTARPFAQADPETSAGPHYQNVVFHPQSTADTVEKPLLTREQPSSKYQAPPKQPAARPAVKHSIHRATPFADGIEPGIQSIVIITRWQAAPGGRMTMIDQIVRISAFSAAPPQAGWFAVQL